MPATGPRAAGVAAAGEYNRLPPSRITHMESASEHTPSSTHPRLAVVYLVAVTIAAFAIPAWGVTAPWRWYCLPSLVGLQIVLLLGFGASARDIVRAALRLRWLFVFLLATYALLPSDTGASDTIVNWRPIASARAVSVNVSGLAVAAMMCLQIMTVTLVSAVVRRSGRGTNLVDGLRAFHVPVLFVYSIDFTLALLGGVRLRDGGGGMGGGGGRARGTSTREALDVIRRFLRGDVEGFTAAIRQRLDQAREHVARETGGRLESDVVHDVAVITGISLMMMSLKMLKILPGIPFFSGFKTMLLYPLYILASELTYSRWGGTVCGTIMGVIGFMQGDGRYGAMEILKHTVPGFLVDVTWPVVKRLPRSAFVYCVLGLVLAIARTSTEFLTVLLLRPRDEVLLFPFFKLIPNVVAGTLSGLVTYFVLPGFRRADATAAIPTTTAEPELPARVPGSGMGRGSGGGRGRRGDTFAE